jgi:hypothetical protein
MRYFNVKSGDIRNALLQFSFPTNNVQQATDNFLTISHAYAEIVIGGFVDQWPSPPDFCKVTVCVEDFAGAVDLEMDPSARSGGIIGLKVNTIGAIVVNRAVIVETSAKIFNHNISFDLKPLADSLVSYRNHRHTFQVTPGLPIHSPRQCLHHRNSGAQTPWRTVVLVTRDINLLNNPKTDQKLQPRHHPPHMFLIQ